MGLDLANVIMALEDKYQFEYDEDQFSSEIVTVEDLANLTLAEIKRCNKQDVNYDELLSRIIEVVKENGSKGWFGKPCGY